MVALLYVSESSRAVRERQMRTEREMKTESEVSWGVERCTFLLQKDYIRKPLRIRLGLVSKGPGSPGLWSHFCPAASPPKASTGIRKPSQPLCTTCPYPPLKIYLIPFLLLVFLQSLGPSFLPKCNHLVPSLGFLHQLLLSLLTIYLIPYHPSCHHVFTRLEPSFLLVTCFLFKWHLLRDVITLIWRRLPVNCSNASLF